MYVKLTTQEKLKDLRVARHLTLSELADATGIASSTLGEYENNDYKDISSHSLEILAKFYNVSVDYLLGLTENITEVNTPLAELHLTDEAVAVLKSGKINTRLLSEIIAHPSFRRMMTDSEIYVDRIVAGQLQSINAMIEGIRENMISEHGADPNDIYMQSVKAAQISEDDFFRTTISSDLMEILKCIKDNHVGDSTTADTTAADMVKEALHEATHFEGSEEEARMVFLLKQIGIPYSKVSKEELMVLIKVFRRSNLLKSPINKRGKGKKH